MNDKESILLRQMDGLLADIASRDRLIADLKAQINDAGDTDIDWYRQELSKSAVVLKELRTRIAELEAQHCWISVDERLPQNGDFVVGRGRLDDMRAVSILMHRGHMDWFRLVFSHWIPLPPLPNVTEQP